MIAAVGCSSGSARVASSREPSTAAPRVRIDSGIVEGAVLPGAPAIAAFTGIPYASPPIGPLRWTPPRPAASWTGILRARALGPICPQPDITARERRVAAALGADPATVGPQGPMSEDCLFLNVWTTNLGGATRQPVIVWIHGGSYASGSGGDDAASLAALGAVVVTINYRLGVLGFLAHPALTRESPHRSSGNYGLLDQIAALQWVQRNIVRFGGDPDRVTVVGHSAGGGAVLQLIASPLARGLVHRGICHSGTLDMSRPLGEAETAGVALATRLVAPGSAPLPALRAMPVEPLLAATSGGFEGTTDGWVLPVSVPEALRTGRIDQVPVIIGSTADEADIFALLITTRDAYRQQVRTADAARFDRLLARYPADGDRDVLVAARRYMTDRDFVCPTRYFAALRGGRTWLYLFSLRPPPRSSGPELGAFHGSELALLFAKAGIPRDEAHARAGDAMRRYWVRFAAAGDPNQPGLPAWPAYRDARPRHLEIGDPVRVEDHFDRPGCDVMDEAWAADR